MMKNQVMKKMMTMATTLLLKTRSKTQSTGNAVAAITAMKKAHRMPSVLIAKTTGGPTSGGTESAADARRSELLELATIPVKALIAPSQARVEKL